MAYIDPDKVYFLRQVTWLRGLSYDELAMVAALMRDERHGQDKPIIRQGEEGRRFYVLKEGRARVVVKTNDGERIVTRIGPGDNFGEAALVSGQPRGASVICDSPCTVLAMERDDFQLVLSRSPSFAQGLLASMGAWVCNQSGFTQKPLTSPIAVTRIIGGLPLERAMLGARLQQCLSAQVQDPQILLLWADDQPPPSWLQCDGVKGEASAILSDYASRCDRVVVMGGKAQDWRSETDFLVKIDGDVVDRNGAGERCVSVLTKPPAAGIDHASVVLLPELKAWLKEGSGIVARRQFPANLERLTRIVSSRRVGIALGGGAAWGFANIGVLRALKRLEIPIDLVSGTSAGALVGGAYCARGAAGLQSLLDAFAFTPKNLLQLGRGALGGFFSWKKAERLMAHLIPDVDFQSLQTPFYCVSYSVSRGEEVVLSSGSLTKAVAASNAMPMTLAPVEAGQESLIDGGFANNVPASVVYSRGADFIIGVDVVPNRIVSPEHRLAGLKLPGVGRLDASMAAIYALVHHAARGYTYLADIIIEPKLDGMHWYQYERASQIADLAEAQVLERYGQEIQNAYGSFNINVR